MVDDPLCRLFSGGAFFRGRRGNNVTTTAVLCPKKDWRPRDEGHRIKKERENPEKHETGKQGRRGSMTKARFEP